MLLPMVPKSVLVFHCWTINDHIKEIPNNTNRLSQFLLTGSPGSLKRVQGIHGWNEVSGGGVFILNAKSSSRLILVIDGTESFAVMELRSPSLCWRLAWVTLSSSSPFSSPCIRPSPSSRSAVVHQILRAGSFHFRLVYNLWTLILI